MEDNIFYPLFKKNDLFKGLDEEKIQFLFSIGQKISVKQGEYLVKEGDSAKEIFFLLSGTLEISKYDSVHNQPHIIATLEAGSTVGEIALLDKGLRSASVRATSPSELISIPFEKLQDIAEQDKSLYRLFFQLSQNIAGRLRSADDTAFRALQAQLDEYKTRVMLSNFFVYIIIFICAFSFSVDELKYIAIIKKQTTFVTLPLTVTIAFFMFYFVKKYNFPYKILGLTLDNWKRSIYEGIVFTIPILAIITFIKWIAVLSVPPYLGQPLFNGHFSWVILFLYWLFVAPLQELLSRGGLQGTLSHFLTGKHKVLISIFVSNLLFSSVHLFMSLQIAVLVFLPGVYFGWLFSRTNNLIGVWLAHGMVGTWGLMVLGINTP